MSYLITFLVIGAVFILTAVVDLKSWIADSNPENDCQPVIGLDFSGYSRLMQVALLANQDTFRGAINDAGLSDVVAVPWLQKRLKAKGEKPLTYEELDLIAMRSVQHSVLQSKTYQRHQDIVEFIRRVYRSSLVFGSILVLISMVGFEISFFAGSFKWLSLYTGYCQLICTIGAIGLLLLLVVIACEGEASDTIIDNFQCLNHLFGKVFANNFKPYYVEKKLSWLVLNILFEIGTSVNVSHTKEFSVLEGFLYAFLQSDRHRKVVKPTRKQVRDLAVNLLIYQRQRVDEYQQGIHASDYYRGRVAVSCFGWNFDDWLGNLHTDLSLYNKLSWPDFYPLHKLINDPKVATHYERTRRLKLTDQQWKDITDYFKQTNDLVEWVIKRKQPAAVSHVDYDEEIKKIFVEEN